MENKRKRRSYLDRFSAWLLKLLEKSFIGKLFTSYDKANACLQNNSKKIKNRHSPTKKAFAKALEDSVFAKIFPKIFNGLLRVATRSYAIIFFVMSTILFLLYFLNGRTLLVEIFVPFNSFASSVAIMLASFPFLFSKKSLAGTLTQNKLISFFIFDFFGADDEGANEIAKKKKVTGTTLSFFVGATLGLLAYFISPLLVVAIFLIAFLAYIVFRTPEVGIILVVLTLPLADPIITKISLVYIFVAYGVKVILRKRVFTFEYLDIWALVLIVAFTIFGIDYQNIIGSLSIVISNLVVFLSYFIVSNLIRSKEWFQRCIVALTTTGLIVAGVGIVQGILGLLSTQIPELAIFADYKEVISSTFNDNHVFAQFMVITVPFSLVHMFTEKREISKFGDFVITIALVGALFLANSKSAWLGFIAGILLLLIIHNRNFIYLALAVIGAGTGLFFLVKYNPQVNEFVSSIGILEGFDPTTKLNEIFDGIKEFIRWPQILGKGAGSSVPGVGSLPIQLGIEYGIIALIALACFAVVFSMLIFTYCATTSSKNRKSNSSVGLCAMVGLFITGIFSNVWADEKIMLLSVACVALSFAFIKIEKDRVHSAQLEKNELARASIDVEISDKMEPEYDNKRKYVRAPKNMLTNKKNNKALVLDKTGIISISNDMKEDDDLEDDDIEDKNRV